MAHEFLVKATRSGKRWSAWVWMPAIPGRADLSHPYWSLVAQSLPSKEEALARGQSAAKERT